MDAEACFSFARSRASFLGGSNRTLATARVHGRLFQLLVGKNSGRFQMILHDRLEHKVENIHDGEI